MKAAPRPGTLVRLDGRSREARLLDQVRTDLTAHAGGNPNAVQRMTIDQIAQQRLLIARMERKFAETDDAPLAADVDVYNKLNGRVDRLMRSLGLKPQSDRPQTLAEILAQAPPRQPSTATTGRALAHGTPAPPSRSSLAQAPAREDVAA